MIMLVVFIVVMILMMRVYTYMGFEQFSGPYIIMMVMVMMIVILVHNVSGVHSSDDINDGSIHICRVRAVFRSVHNNDGDSSMIVILVVVMVVFQWGYFHVSYEGVSFRGMYTLVQVLASF